MAVVAVDPGEKCGVARYVDGEISAIQCDYRTALDDYVLPWLRTLPQVECSVERYTVGAQTLKKTRQPTAQHVVGIIKTECERLGVPFVQYGPGDAKKLGRPELLRSLGIYLPGLDHANDALSHLLLTLANRHRAEFVRLVKSGTVRLS